MRKNNNKSNFLNQLLVSIIILVTAFKFGDALSRKLQSRIDRRNE
ncbi:protein of unknown function [Petrocella atlantisensis]|uniref:Uncharacterized protein n=1 Tax=Petrocella atlantisensis TaxID=2173034 RepID=A0A3P7RWE7_9FIRM|nr:protein of unknown function [Petrocella atlantisensis]